MGSRNNYEELVSVEPNHVRVGRESGPGSPVSNASREESGGSGSLAEPSGQSKLAISDPWWSLPQEDPKAEPLYPSVIFDL